MFLLHEIADALDTRMRIHQVNLIAGCRKVCLHRTAPSTLSWNTHKLLGVEDTGGPILFQVHPSKLWSTVALIQKTLECVGLPLACPQ
mmetsp:Transcript_11104/g.68400  ORF Transcript_11104/g.68400 Transcript_11104/m.68400 type:complete len:88 (-) Transcript_11104:1351-1614(-)